MNGDDFEKAVGNRLGAWLVEFSARIGPLEMLRIIDAIRPLFPVVMEHFSQINAEDRASLFEDISIALNAYSEDLREKK